MMNRNRAALNRDLLAAVDTGDLGRVKEMVAAGADPRRDHDSALCAAATNGDLALVRYLIEACGADPEARDEYGIFGSGL